jgi:hypothetical protein
VVLGIAGGGRALDGNCPSQRLVVSLGGARAPVVGSAAYAITSQRVNGSGAMGRVLSRNGALLGD